MRVHLLTPLLLLLATVCASSVLALRLPDTLIEGSYGAEPKTQRRTVYVRSPNKEGEPFVVQPVTEECFTAMTVEHTLLATKSAATMEMIRQHQWLFLKYLTGYEAIQETALSLEDTVDYNDALLTLQIYAAVRFTQRQPAGYCDGGEKSKLCSVADSALQAISSRSSRRGVRESLRGWALKSDNLTTGPGSDAETRRFEVGSQRATKSLLVPPMVHYYARFMDQQVSKILDLLDALQVYLNVFGEPVDKLLAEHIYSVVVAPTASPAIAPHGKLWCPISTFLVHDCGIPNAQLGLVAKRQNRRVVDDRDGGDVEVADDEATRLVTDRVVLTPIAGRILRQGDQLRVCLTGDRETNTATSQLFVTGTGYPFDSLPRIGRRSFRAQMSAETFEEPSDAKRRQDVYFDVHLEMSPTPVAVDRGCLSAPLAVRGDDGFLPPILMDCMVIQQLMVEEQTTYKTVVEGADLQRKVDYLAFLQDWLRHVVAFNYSMPYVQTSPREDLTGPDHYIVTRPDVVPTWCVTKGKDELMEDEKAVCHFLHRVKCMIADAKEVFAMAELRLDAGIKYLEKEMQAHLGEMLQLRRETERRMLPIQKVLNHEGWSCSATWCGGGMLGLEARYPDDELPKLK